MISNSFALIRLPRFHVVIFGAVLLLLLFFVCVLLLTLFRAEGE